MNMVAICSIGLFSTFLSVLMKKYNPEYSLALGIVSGVLILGVILSRATDVLLQIQNILKATNIPLEYIQILFKALGICFLTQFASDACKDAGEGALSSKIEMAGKITILIMSLPLFEKITDIAMKLIGQV